MKFKPFLPKIVIYTFAALPYLAIGQQFTSKEVKFTNKKDTVELAGTLLIPSKPKHPKVAILVSGSGQSDRDETILGHKPFKVIAEHLAQNGIAVLRYDDRGGGQSTGRKTINSTTYELSEDAEAAFEFIKSQSEFQKSKIGFIGHSEGGLIAPMVAARNNQVSFIVSLAGPSTPILDLMSRQNYDILVSSKIDSAIALKYTDEYYRPAMQILLENQPDSVVKKQLIRLTTEFKTQLPGHNKMLLFGSADFIATTFIKQVRNPFMIYFIKMNPKTYWENVKCSALALYGEKDLQVNPNENSMALKEINPKIKVRILPKHNHLFQEANYGTLQEYSQIKHAISDEALAEITDWLVHLKK